MPKAVKMYSPMKISMKISSNEGMIEIKVSMSSLRSFNFLTSRATRMMRKVRITVIADFKLN